MDYGLVPDKCLCLSGPSSQEGIKSSVQSGNKEHRLLARKDINIDDISFPFSFVLQLYWSQSLGCPLLGFIYLL